jgi:hypothetical protein
MALRSSFLLLLGVAGACAPPPLLRLPSGPGAPASDGPAVLADATAECSKVSSILTEASVRGSAGGQRVRATLHLGVAAPGSARIEAIAPFGQPLFTFVARDDKGTLLLTRPDRVIADASPAALLEAVTGVPLDPPGLLAALAGCASAPRVEAARQVSGSWRVIPDGVSELYFTRASASAPWQLVAALHQDARMGPWRAEYHERGADGVPRRVRLASRNEEGFNLQLGLAQVEINAVLGTPTFEVAIPPGAQTLTIQELREGVVLSEATSGQDANAR